MRAVFVRHGQSTGNAGQPISDLVLMPLTPLGVEQAQTVALSWGRAPSHIISSPFLRARQTAALTCALFAEVPLEIWPIQEFTYLSPTRWINSTRAQRRPAVQAYWQRGDPESMDGDGAESFSGVLRRAEAALTRLSQLPQASEAVLFSHGQFMQAVRHSVESPALDNRAKMARFWQQEQLSPMLNGQKLHLQWTQGRWVVEEHFAIE